VRLRVQRLDPAAKMPTISHEGDAGFDLYAIDEVTLEPGDRAAIRTGIAVEVSHGHAALVLPRSGLAAKHGISVVNAPGLIDSGYRGEVRVLLINTDPAEVFRIEPGDRIAQLLVTPIALPAPVEAEALAESARGEGGFGSSGR
jgi:dUTP pyrophosphatase